MRQQLSDLGGVRFCPMQKKQPRTFALGDIPQVLEGIAKAIPDREPFSLLAACWYSEFGGLNKFGNFTKII